MTTYTLAGGCFWCLDAVFRQLHGVKESLCGYAGGAENEADYYKVASGQTGHAEAVSVTFDETVLPKEVLLNIFFLIHDPTSLNRQGADTGPQYRSAMFPSDDEQKDEFKLALERAQKVWDKSLVTTMEEQQIFYKAETEHQDYFANNPANPYCAVVIDPKVRKARANFAKYFTS